MTLNQLQEKETVCIQTIHGDQSFRHQLFCMGCLPSTPITLIKRTPFNNPLLFHLHSYVLALRIEDAKKIEVLPCSKWQ